jgi:5-(carboxyamino)imidazole ribonucleotide synthase
MKVGVIGGGQLAQMLAEAGEPLGIGVYALVSSADCPAQYSAQLVIGDQNKLTDTQKFADQVDVLTFEFENVNFNSLQTLTLPIYPPLTALQIAQDRELEKNCFIKNAIPTTHFQIVNNLVEATAALNVIGLPAVIKTCRDGYDGKGQAVIHDKAQLSAQWPQFERVRVIIENVVPFEKEVSIIAVRDRQGKCGYYPLTENQHDKGILRVSKAPYQNEHLQILGEHYAEKILTALNYVGVLAIEFFVVGKDLIANEMAPRVHNSGHWTIEGAHTSQFENHLRAVCGLPLGNTAAQGYSAMINFIGTEPAVTEVLALPDTHFHTYHKSSRPGRKLAHATTCADTEKKRDENLKLLQNLIFRQPS